MHDLDRVLHGDDVHGPLCIEHIDERRECGCLARPTRPGHHDQPLMVVEYLAKLARHANRIQSWRFVHDQAKASLDACTLLVHVHPKATRALDFAREVRVSELGELRLTARIEQWHDKRPRLLVVQRPALSDEVAATAKPERLARHHMDVACAVVARCRKDLAKPIGARDGNAPRGSRRNGRYRGRRSIRLMRISPLDLRRISLQARGVRDRFFLPQWRGRGRFHSARRGCRRNRVLPLAAHAQHQRRARSLHPRDVDDAIDPRRHRSGRAVTLGHDRLKRSVLHQPQDVLRTQGLPRHRLELPALLRPRCGAALENDLGDIAAIEVLKKLRQF